MVNTNYVFSQLAQLLYNKIDNRRYVFLVIPVIQGFRNFGKSGGTDPWAKRTTSFGPLGKTIASLRTFLQNKQLVADLYSKQNDLVKFLNEIQ